MMTAKDIVAITMGTPYPVEIRILPSGGVIVRPAVGSNERRAMSGAERARKFRQSHKQPKPESVTEVVTPLRESVTKSNAATESNTETQSPSLPLSSPPSPPPSPSPGPPTPSAPTPAPPRPHTPGRRAHGHAPTHEEQPDLLPVESSESPTAKRKSAASAEAEKASSTPLPLDLRTAEFEKNWKLWCQYRTEMGQRDRTKPWTLLAAQATLRLCQKHGPGASCHAMTKALAGNWQGLHFDDPPRPQNGNGNAPQSTPDINDPTLHPAVRARLKAERDAQRLTAPIL